MGGGELVDEIALRAHHFDAVVAGLPRQPTGAHVSRDLAFHATRRQRARPERGDRRLDRRGRHHQRLVTVAARVQDLQADLAGMLVHRPRDPPVARQLAPGHQRGAERRQPAAHAGREAAGDHQAGAAGGPFGKIGRQARIIPGAVLQAGVHGAHQHAVGQPGEPQVQRREQVWKRR